MRKMLHTRYKKKWKGLTETSYILKMFVNSKLISRRRIQKSYYRRPPNEINKFSSNL